MTGVKMLLVGGVAATVLPSDMTTLIDAYKAGGVAVLLIVALVVIYRDGKKSQATSNELIRQNAEATTKNAEATTRHADATSKQAEATFQMANAVTLVVRECAVRRGVQMQVPVVPEVPRDGVSK
jgi:hypothetical protein